MSRWWRDSLAVALAPERVRLARIPRRGRPAAPVWSDYPVEPGTLPPDTLASALRDRRWRDTAAEVRLHSRYARWMLLPFTPAIATDAEWVAYARAEFEGVHGERARGWEVRVTAPRAGEAAPACAVDAELVAQVASACNAAGVRLDGVAPAFVGAFDAHRALLRATVSAFAYVQDDRLTLAVFEAGRWCALEAARLGPALEESLGAALVQATAGRLTRADGGRVWVAGDGPAMALPARIGTWDVVNLSAASAAGRSARIPAPAALESRA